MIGLKTTTWGFLRSLKTVEISDFEMTAPTVEIRRPYLRFPVKIRKFWSGKINRVFEELLRILLQI